MTSPIRLPDRGERRRRGRRAARSLLGAVALVALLAPPALATRVTDVRVGRHPTFTRIVFELDGPTGYKLDRTDSGGAAELVVTLNASGKDQKLALPKSLVDRVDVRSEGRSTVARIRLARSGLGLKELMLNSPSRIVLDVLEDAPAPAVAKSAPKPSPTKIAAAPKPAPVAKTEKTERITAPAAVAKPAPAPRVAPEPAPAPEPAMAPAGGGTVPAGAGVPGEHSYATVGDWRVTFVNDNTGVRVYPGAGVGQPATGIGGRYQSGGVADLSP